MKVFTNGVEWYVAKNRKDLEKVIVDYWGTDEVLQAEEDGYYDWHKVNLFKQFIITFEAPLKKYPLFSKIEKIKDWEAYKVTNFLLFWALWNGRGFLCTTEY
jgi:hypothetical protein